jgi:hypothetical protein
VRVVKKVPKDVYFACQGGMSQDDLTEENIQGKMTYDDVRSNEIAPVYPKLKLMPNSRMVEEFFGSEARQIVSRRIPAEFGKYDDFIVEDLTLCACARMVNGDKDSIFERIFAVLKSGGWVVGWDGTYPEIVELLAIYPGLRR